MQNLFYDINRAEVNQTGLSGNDNFIAIIKAFNDFISRSHLTAEFNQFFIYNAIVINKDITVVCAGLFNNGYIRNDNALFRTARVDIKQRKLRRERLGGSDRYLRPRRERDDGVCV